MKTICAIFPYKLDSDSGHKIRAKNIISLFRKGGNRVEVIEPKQFNESRNKFLAYLLNWFIVFRIFFRNLSYRKCEYIYTRGLIPFPFLYILKIMRKKIIFDLPVEHTPKGFFKKNKSFKNFYECFDFFLTNRHVNFILTENEILKRNHVNEGIPYNKSIVVPHSVNINNFPITPRKNINKLVRCVYVGQLSIKNKLEELLEIFSEINKERNDVILYIIGSGHFLKYYENKIKKENLQKKIIFKGKMDHDNVIKFLKKMDIALFTQEGTNATKIPEYMASQLPTISISENAILLKKSGGGLLSKDWMEYKENLILLINNKNLRIIIGKRAREYIENYLTDEIVIEKINNILFAK